MLSTVRLCVCSTWKRLSRGRGPRRAQVQHGRRPCCASPAMKIMYILTPVSDFKLSLTGSRLPSSRSAVRCPVPHPVACPPCVRVRCAAQCGCALRASRTRTLPERSRPAQRLNEISKGWETTHFPISYTLLTTNHTTRYNALQIHDSCMLCYRSANVTITTSSMAFAPALLPGVFAPRMLVTHRLHRQRPATVWSPIALASSDYPARGRGASRPACRTEMATSERCRS